MTMIGIKSNKIMTIKIEDTDSIIIFHKKATEVDGDVDVIKGRYVIDAKSLMGVMSININTGVQVVYPSDAKDFENFISQYEVD